MNRILEAPHCRSGEVRGPLAKVAVGLGLAVLLLVAGGALAAAQGDAEPSVKADLELLRGRVDEARAALGRSEAAQQALVSQLEEAQAQRGDEVESEALDQLRSQLRVADENLERVRAHRQRLQEALAEAERVRLALTRQVFEETVADLERQLDEAADDVRRSAAESADLEASLGRAHSELEELGNRLATVELDRERLVRERDRLAADLESERAKGGAERRSLSAEKAQLEQQVESLEETSEMLRRELVGREQSLDEMELQLEDLARVRRESAELRSDRDQLAGQLSASRTLLTEAETAQTLLRGERDRLAIELEAQGAQATAVRGTLEATAREQQLRIESLEAETGELTAEIEENSATMAQLRGELTALRESGELSTAELAEKDAALAELSVRLSASEAAAGELRGERDRLARQIETMRAGAVADLESSKAARIELQQQVDARERIAGDLERELAAREVAIAELRQRLDAEQSAQETFAEKDRLLEDLRVALDQARLERLEAERQATAARNRSTELDLRLQQARALLAEFNSRLEQRARAGLDGRASVESPPSPPPSAVELPREPIASGAAGSRELRAALPTASDPVSGGGAATRVERITWREQGTSLEIIIDFDGLIQPADCEVSKLRSGEPRDIVKIGGIRQAFSPARLDVSNVFVRRIRTGLHSPPVGTELHVVIDLAQPNVGIRSVTADAKRLIVTIF